MFFERKGSWRGADMHGKRNEHLLLTAIGGNQCRAASIRVSEKPCYT
jgi:hypothetical protein